MKVSYALLGLLLFGFINLSTDDPNIYDIEVLNEYTFITNYDNYYFRMPVSSLDNMYVRLKCPNTGYNSIHDFKFDICGFNGKPSREQVKQGHSYCANYNTPTIDYEGQNAIYKYYFSTLENINYLALSLYMQTGIRPYTLYVYSENSLGVSIILLIIFLPCIIVAAIVVAVCKFCCGGCRIRINAGGSSGNYI